MSTGYGPKIATDNLICYLDPGHVSSYSPPGPELVTNSNLLTIGDGNYENVKTDPGCISIGAACTVGELYTLKWRNSRRSGTVGADMRSGYTSPTRSPNINQPINITYIGGWVPASSSAITRVCAGNTGVDFDLDYLSMRLMSKNINSLVGPNRTISIKNNPGYDDIYKCWFFLDPAYIEIPYNIDLNWDPGGTNGSSQKTIEMWIKTDDTSGTFFSKPWNGGGQYNYRLHHDSFIIISGGGGRISDGRDEFYFPSLADNKWHHVVAWISETHFGLIIDGSITYTSKHTQSPGPPSSGNGSLSMSIMTVYPYGNYSVNVTAGNSQSGSVGLFRVYNKVLSTVEIQHNYISQAMRFLS